MTITTITTTTTTTDDDDSSALFDGINDKCPRFPSPFLTLIGFHAHRKAVKNKKDVIRTIISAVRDTCVDWPRSYDPQEDPATQGKKDPDEGVSIKTCRRNVGPSTTQLYMVRTMLGKWQVFGYR